MRWACLTGMAQTSLVWRGLVSLESDDHGGAGRTAQYVESARLVNAFLMRTQDRSSSVAGLRGGIRGSFPVNGAYGRWRVLNWATKFFIDALMADLPERVGTYRG